MFFVYNTGMRHRPGGGDRAVRLLPLLLLLIGAAALLLGILQFRWISRVTASEGSRLKQSLRSSAARVLDAAADEVRVLQAFVYLTGEEYENQDWLRLGSSLEFWKANSRFPDLLAGVYLVELRDRDNPVFLQYSPQQRAFHSAGEPPLFEGLLSKENLDDPLSRSHVETLIQRGVIVSPVGMPGQPAEEGGSEPYSDRIPPFSSFLAMVVDLQVLYRQVIPFYMEYYLEAHPYRLREGDRGVTIVSSGNPDPTREAELSVTARTPLLFWDRGPDAAGERERQNSLARSLLEAYAQQHQGEDPSVRFWLQRSRMIGMDSGRPPEADTGSGTSIVLEIYYPGGSIHRLTSVRRTVNLAVSVGVLLLLVASSVVLFRLYRNTTRLRATEQEFVASMSHELRTPIAVLQATTENLKSGLVTDPDRASRYGEIIHRETRRLAGMVESILLYSGLENRCPRSTVSILVDPQQLIAEVINSLQEPAREAASTIRLIQRTSLGQIRCDPTALRLILENLLLNAIRHGLSDDRSAENPSEIRLIAQRKVFHGALVVAVEDDGPGIPPKEARRIFDPFVRGEASIREQRPGSGLGLHLVRRVVQILGGSITLDSPYRNTIGRIQSGCRFTVELPAIPDTTPQSRQENDAEDPHH